MFIEVADIWLWACYHAICCLPVHNDIFEAVLDCVLGEKAMEAIGQPQVRQGKERPRVGGTKIFAPNNQTVVKAVPREDR